MWIYFIFTRFFLKKTTISWIVDKRKVIVRDHSQLTNTTQSFFLLFVVNVSLKGGARSHIVLWWTKVIIKENGDGNKSKAREKKNQPIVEIIRGGATWSFSFLYDQRKWNFDFFSMNLYDKRISTQIFFVLNKNWLKIFVRLKIFFRCHSESLSRERKVCNFHQ